MSNRPLRGAQEAWQRGGKAKTAMMLRTTRKNLGKNALHAEGERSSAPTGAHRSLTNGRRRPSGHRGDFAPRAPLAALQAPAAAQAMRAGSLPTAKSCRLVGEGAGEEARQRRSLTLTPRLSLRSSLRSRVETASALTGFLPRTSPSSPTPTTLPGGGDPLGISLSPSSTFRPLHALTRPAGDGARITASQAYRAGLAVNAPLARPPLRYGLTGDGFSLGAISAPPRANDDDNVNHR